MLIENLNRIQSIKEIEKEKKNNENKDQVDIKNQYPQVRILIHLEIHHLFKKNEMVFFMFYLIIIKVVVFPFSDSSKIELLNVKSTLMDIQVLFNEL